MWNCISFLWYESLKEKHCIRIVIYVFTYCARKCVAFWKKNHTASKDFTWPLVMAVATNFNSVTMTYDLNWPYKIYLLYNIYWPSEKHWPCNIDWSYEIYWPHNIYWPKEIYWPANTLAFLLRTSVDTSAFPYLQHRL